jgi:hypothetical protein
MSKKLATFKSKLFKLKEWLTVSEAGKHISEFLNEEVSEADVLRLALDGHLKLSVNFVNNITCRVGKIVSNEDLEYTEHTFEEMSEGFPDGDCPYEDNGKPIRLVRDHLMPDGRYFRFERDTEIINGIWDLCLIGGEKKDVEHKYQMLSGGPKVTNLCFNGAFVEREGRICHLWGKEGQNQRLYIPRKDFYFHLPSDSMLVVRKQALRNFQENFYSDESAKERKLIKNCIETNQYQVELRAETTYHNIIGALLEYIKGEAPGISMHQDFESQNKLIELFASYGIRGLSKSNLDKKFSAAKQTYYSEIR